MADIERLRLELEIVREKRLLVEAEQKAAESRGEKRKRSKKDKGKEKVRDKGKEKVKEKEKEKEKEKDSDEGPSSAPPKKKTRFGVSVFNPLDGN